MKNLLFLASVLFVSFVKAQLPVTDVNTNAQLFELNRKIEVLLKENTTTAVKSGMTEANTMNTKLLSQDNLDFIGKVEDTFWIVDESLKKGNEIKAILQAEKDILNQIMTLRREASSAGLSHNQVNAYYAMSRNLLTNTGKLVDMSMNILTDNVFKMEYNDRRKYLQEILGGLTEAKLALGRKLAEVQTQKIMKERERASKEEQKANAEKIKHLRSLRGK